MTNQKTLEDYLNEVVENPAHKLEVSKLHCLLFSRLTVVVLLFV